MPSRVLVHLPPPEPPQLVDRPPRRPARGEEFPIGWTVADYQLERGEFGGEEYAYEVWVIPLLVDEGPASTDPPPGEAGSGDCSEQCSEHGTLAAVPSLYGHHLTPEDGDRLVGALTDAGTHASLEAAAAIRWGEATGVPVEDLEPELCRAILDVLGRAGTDLESLRGGSRGQRSPHEGGRASSARFTTRAGEHAAASTTAGASERSGGARSAGTCRRSGTAPFRHAGSRTGRRSAPGAHAGGNGTPSQIPQQGERRCTGSADE